VGAGAASGSNVFISVSRDDITTARFCSWWPGDCRFCSRPASSDRPGVHQAKSHRPPTVGAFTSLQQLAIVSAFLSLCSSIISIAKEAGGAAWQ